MNKIKKLIQYAVFEIVTAEDYIKMAESYADNESIALKFQEIAKDEIEHHVYDMSIVNKMIKEEQDEGKTVLELENSLLYDVYYDWFKSVEARVNNFKIKR